MPGLIRDQYNTLAFDGCFVLEGASLIAQLVKNLPATQEISWVGKIPWRKDRLPTPVFLGFPCGSAGKESVCNAGDLGSIQETWVRCLGWEDPLDKGKATHSSILAWRIPKESHKTERLALSLFFLALRKLLVSKDFCNLA